MPIFLLVVQTHKPPIRKHTVSKNKKWYKATVVEGQVLGSGDSLFTHRRKPLPPRQ